MELGTKVERLTFSTSCEIRQRISVHHRVQHMHLMACASSMVSLGQLQHMRPWPSRSCIWCWLVLTMLTVCWWSTGLWILTLHPPSRHGMREEHTGNVLEYTIKSGSQHLPPQFKRVLCNGSYKEELNFSWKIERTRPGSTLDSKHCTLHLVLNVIESHPQHPGLSSLLSSLTILHQGYCAWGSWHTDTPPC